MNNRLVEGRIYGYIQIKIEDPVTLLISYNDNTDNNTKKCRIEIYKNDLYKMFKKNNVKFSIFRQYNVTLNFSDDTHFTIQKITEIA